MTLTLLGYLALLVAVAAGGFVWLLVTVEYAGWMQERANFWRNEREQRKRGRRIR